jgi:hypothetical protein
LHAVTKEHGNLVDLCGCLVPESAKMGLLLRDSSLGRGGEVDPLRVQLTGEVPNLCVIAAPTEVGAGLRTSMPFNIRPDGPDPSSTGDRVEPKTCMSDFAFEDGVAEHS